MEAISTWEVIFMNIKIYSQVIDMRKESWYGTIKRLACFRSFSTYRRRCHNKSPGHKIISANSIKWHKVDLITNSSFSYSLFLYSNIQLMSISSRVRLSAKCWGIKHWKKKYIYIYVYIWRQSSELAEKCGKNLRC